MKPNKPHHWTIELKASVWPSNAPTATQSFTGDIEGVLQEADELESEVEFEVVQFVITRGEPA